MAAPTPILASPDSDLPRIIRPFEGDKSDSDYIISTWVYSYKGKVMPGGYAYERAQWKLADALLRCCGCLIASLDTDPSHIMGWAVTSLDCVHYVYVADDYRQHGLAKDLLAPYLSRRGIIYTHTPNRAWWPPDPNRPAPQTKRFIPKVPDGWMYNPFHAFELASQTQSYREVNGNGRR